MIYGGCAAYRVFLQSLAGIGGLNSAFGHRLGCLAPVSAVCCTGRSVCDWPILHPGESS